MEPIGAIRSQKELRSTFYGANRSHKEPEGVEVTGVI
jgi:hypothetical protein